METKTTYSLCPTAGDSRQRLYDEVKTFAEQQGARLIDRSSGAKQELSDLQSGVLKNTGGDPILLTVEKAGQYRVSVTNLGLKEKVALSVRSLGEASSMEPISAFIDSLGRYWAIKEVGGSVQNDPPC